MKSSLMKGRGRNHCNLAIYVVVIWQLNSAIYFSWHTDFFLHCWNKSTLSGFNSLSTAVQLIVSSPPPLVLVVLAILGNGLVLIVTLKFSAPRTLSLTLIFSLALINILVGLVVQLALVVYIAGKINLIFYCSALVTYNTHKYFI